ncbi:protein artemis-like [Saccostrea echinata]|uniref:protein artemis-like n=1 Tax=Saccostrea echinata TaxID=191078 RepID=UPI002A832426|nr:protein artemis-like [Saccostrea echinata]
MSCFNGKMREYRNISLDRFDGLNLRSTAYFLSHCHCDHMQGLGAVEFIERLSSRNDIFLYCSEITKILLMEKHPKLEKFVRTLQVAEPIVIPIPEPDSAKKDEVTVTLIHASHCPGSVMFLFEGFDGTVLYTGDFRWESDQVMKIQALHVDQRVKPLVSLYVDTTFCHPNCFSIPSRQTIISAACDLVKEWTAKGDNYVVHFTPRANYGHEPLLKEVAQALGSKVHVRRDKEDIYNRISELRGIFTSDSAATPIHACGGRVYGEVPSLPCDRKNKNLKVMVILPSTMFFTQSFRLSEDEIVLRDKGIYRICYSFHSSMLEVRDLVTYLQPRCVFPNVKPAEDASLAQVQRRLNEFLKLKHGSHVKDQLDTQRPLGLLKQSFKRKKHSVSVGSSDSEELLFGSQISFSPKKRKTLSASPAKNRITEKMEDEEEYQSSYEGSRHSDSEMSGICESDEEDRKENSQTLSTPRQSLLEAINSQKSSQSESLSHRIVVYDDCEQTEGKALSLEEVNQQHQDDDEESYKGESDHNENNTTLGLETVNGDRESADPSKLNTTEDDEGNLKAGEFVEGKTAAGSLESNKQTGSLESNKQTGSLESNKQTGSFSGSNDLFDEKSDEKCNILSDNGSSVCDLHISPSDCDNQSNSLSVTPNLTQGSNNGIVCDIQESQGFNTHVMDDDKVELTHFSDNDDTEKKIKLNDFTNNVIIITDESVSSKEDYCSRCSSQESKISINDTVEKKPENEKDITISNGQKNVTGNSKNREFLDDVEVEDSDDDVEVVEMSTTVQQTSTSLGDVPGRSTSLQEESDSDATLPPSQNSYSESPLKHKRSETENCVEIIETETENYSHCANKTPRKLYQSSIDCYISPSKDSPEKCSPSIVKRRKKSNGWLNASHRKLVYVSEEEECSGNDKVVDLTISSDEDS